MPERIALFGYRQVCRKESASPSIGTPLRVRPSRNRTRSSCAVGIPNSTSNGLAEEEELRLRFDVLTKTRQPELHRYWTTRDGAANVRLYRLAAEILGAVEAGVFPPRVGWYCADCPVRGRCWAWGCSNPKQSVSQS